MRSIVCLLAICLPLITLAQKDLSGSRRSSVYTYYYKLSPREAARFQAHPYRGRIDKYLHTLVDSVLTDSVGTKKLSPGNYLEVVAKNNLLEQKAVNVGSLRTKLVDNGDQLLLLLHDPQSQLVKDARVQTGNRQAAFNEQLKGFPLPKRNRHTTVNIEYQGVLQQLPLKSGKRSFLSSLAYTLRKPFQRRTRYHYSPEYFQTSTAYEKKYRGFLVFSKPRYREGDTVQLKAWIADKNGKPVNRPMLLRLTDRDFLTDSILAEIKPYRPGGFTYSFVLNDSLDLYLDEDYLLTFEELKSRKYDLETYDGNLDEDEYALKRLVTMRGKFTYEDYELKGIQFSARTDHSSHHQGMPVTIYCKAKDENDLPVMDGRVKILASPAANPKTFYHASEVFIRDTLWYHEQVLEPIGETGIQLPDSLFPAASFDYNLQLEFLNSNNENSTATLHQHYNYRRRQLVFKQEKDSLQISLLDGARSILASATLVLLNGREDTLQTTSLLLPARIALDPYAQQYRVRVDTLSNEFTIPFTQGLLECRARRTRDSVIVTVLNPGRLSFWYTLFAGNKVVTRGYGDSFYYADKAQSPAGYSISLQYIFGDQVRAENYTLAYYDKALVIESDQPATIYPGQVSRVTLQVRDMNGRPVPDADVSSFAYTTKFKEQGSLQLPYFGKLYGPRKIRQPLSLGYASPAALLSLLNWERWSREMGLDSLDYFRFLHPDTVYRNTEPMADSITQLAPFVVSKGELQPVFQVYIDSVPFFFSQSSHLQRYSFRVQPGYHTIELRMSDKLIRLKNVYAAPFHKTVISVNADQPAKDMEIMKRPGRLTPQEMERWSRYMIMISRDRYELSLVQLTQGNNILLLQQPTDHYNFYQPLVGPLTGLPAIFSVRGKISQSFTPQGNSSYSILNGLVKQRQPPPGKYLFGNWLGSTIVPDLKDKVLTAQEVDSLWQEYLDNRSSSTELFRNASFNKTGNGSLEIALDSLAGSQRLFIKHTFLFRHDNPDFLQIYKGQNTELGYLQPGHYRLLLLLKGNQYYIRDSILVRPGGVNYVNFGTIAPRPPDSMSIYMNELVESRVIGGWEDLSEYTGTEMLETFNEQYLDTSSFTNQISGRVLDKETNAPLSGVMVRIRGVNRGTITDGEGYFTLLAPEKGTLTVVLIGYQALEKKISPDAVYNLLMVPSKGQLNEVVVVGYGGQRKRSLTGAALSFTMADGLAGAAPGIMIRGMSSYQETGLPLVLMDGLPYTGNLQSIDPVSIASFNILRGPEAIALYGSSAAGGVILITTRKAAALAGAEAGADQPLPGNSLRRNFRDDAYWQPALRTDQLGRVSYTVTWPDDITSWKTKAIAIDNQRRSGILETVVRSFKALSTSLALPQFLIAGDTAQVLGKTQHYGGDSVRLQTAFFYQDSLMVNRTVVLRHSLIDSFLVTAPVTDSVRFKMTIRQENGYYDGEERTIPVFPQGVKETKGFFASLETDTSFTIVADPRYGQLTIRAEAALLPVMLEEIDRIRDYEYDCNEQLVSRLKALLLKKTVYAYGKQDFREEKNIRELISRLQQNQLPTGGWAWWSGQQPLTWISLHAMEALLMAEKAGYRVAVNKSSLLQYLSWELEQYKGLERLQCLQLLHVLGGNIDFRSQLDTLERKLHKPDEYTKLSLLAFRQQLGQESLSQELAGRYKQTLFGNRYYGEDSYRFFDNSIQQTLLMYRMMRKAGGYEQELKSIRNYFLEKRKDGQWRNTYESCLILETILPDLLRDSSQLTPARLELSGGSQAIVTSFPYTSTLPAGESVTIRKLGGQPVYFSSFQQHWNPAPQQQDAAFSVRSSFVRKNGEPLTRLTAGDPVKLKVNVTVTGDADYVLVEIPIPAGCSYQDKQPAFANNEVHREHFRNKVSIFCSSLKQGQYSFEVSLLPRYTGSYFLNPAKAEMMYFPVFSGRESMKKTIIQ
ncbi:MAG: carboxypeptidase-like regulatory domain-containing protein [Candidatus Pseudobacter hemicellulosilyticus]|uniref:Carboxypeptidase-like regulatory domain-containing protein n=1 Tax=Candidatus Pseudobacter hemicellulosilyticus TaxID=3121375 RepID=A0AAJ6BIE3_9BACT|nr:MAG: carboxypeptidase-like regulatory domain-containing protein [Pseudobacter sp.]